MDVHPRCRLFSSARITWQILTADGDSDGRGIYDGCQPIGPLALNPGAYDVQIDAQSTGAGYQFTARSSRGWHAAHYHLDHPIREESPP